MLEQARAVRTPLTQGSQLATSSEVPAHVSTGAPVALPAAAQPAAEEADDEEPETLPLLARRVMAGRQSIVPHHKVLHKKGERKICRS